MLQVDRSLPVEEDGKKNPGAGQEKMGLRKKNGLTYLDYRV
jgi:hypothetical protein